MRRVAKLEIIFGLFALALIYFVIVNNTSITGFVISPANGITLISPSDNTQTKETNIYFMFKYPTEFKMEECSLILNDQVARTTKGLLSPYDTRIRAELVPGTYYWSIECTDTNNMKLSSTTRRLVIEEKEESALRITGFLNRQGFVYEFELKDGLELNISNVVPNDVIRARMNDNTYEISILRVIQDYSTGTESVEFLVTPGDKRIKLEEGGLISVDFNNDGKNDLNIMLNDISYRRAFFTLSTKQEAQPEEAKPPLSEKPSIITSPAQEKKDKVRTEEQQLAQKPAQAEGLIEIFLIGLIVVMIIIIISTLKNRRDEEKEYITKLKKKATEKRPKRKKRKAKKKISKKKRLKKKSEKRRAKKKQS